MRHEKVTALWLYTLILTPAKIKASISLAKADFIMKAIVVAILASKQWTMTAFVGYCSLII